MASNYHFYIQLYPGNGASSARREIFSYFGAYYRSLSNTAPGEIKNQEVEDYVESPTPRVYLPSEPVHSTTEQVLSLYFKGDSCTEQSQALYDYIANRQFEFSDDFRCQYRTFVLKSMTIKGERLYGGQRYQMVDLTLTNLYGRAFPSTQIPSNSN